MIAAMGLDGVEPRWRSRDRPTRRRSRRTWSRCWCRPCTWGTWWSSTTSSPTWPRGVAAAIERAGASVLPLPPYSPDYTPIEEMFSKVKEFLRRVGARAKEDLYDAIGEA